MASTDYPTTQIFQGLWACLESDSDFTDMVKPGNRIKHVSGTRDPDKTILTTADYPQVAVHHLGFEENWEQDSSTYNLPSIWGIDMQVGKLKLETLTDLEYVIFKALATYWDTTVANLTYNDFAFVCDTGFRSVQGKANIEPWREKRNLRDWISLWTGVINIILPRSWFTV